MKFLIIILLIFLALLQYRLWFSPGGMSDVSELEEVKQGLIDENEQLRERNAALAAEVIDLKHGLEAVEERARSEMGMIKSGEVFYRIVNSQDSTRPDELSEIPLEEPDTSP